MAFSFQGSTIKYCDDQPGREYCRKGESDALRC